MKTEHKFIDLKSLKVRDDGPGSIEGYRSIYGVIDEGGDITIKGCFADSIPEYLNSGFTAESHDWNFKNAIGFPIETYEDNTGWFVKSEFHTTQTAQEVRTIARERMKAGKQVGFSFGYRTDEAEIIPYQDYKRKLPLYLRADMLTAMLAKAERFSQIRILKKLSAIEDSLVTVPMNKLATATGVKSRRSRSAGSLSPEYLRMQHMRLHSKCIATLVGVNLAGATEPSMAQLRAESERLRNKSLRLLYS